MGDSVQAAIDAFLRRLLLRSVLTEEEQAAIRALPGEERCYDERRDIVVPGQVVDQACLVAEGLVARFDQMRDGRRQITAFHLPGDMCDLHSVPVPATGWGVVPCSAATIVRIRHSDLRSLVDRYPAIGMAFWRDTTTDASVLAKALANLARDARTRLAHLFCEIGMRLEIAGAGKRTDYRFLATQEVMADAVGLTSIHVNRVLRTLRMEGAATVRNRRVEIHDWQRLVDIADFDPEYLLLDAPRR